MILIFLNLNQSKIMYDISDIKFICHIAYLVSIFFFDFREQKKSERHVLQEDFNEDRIVFVCFVCARRAHR